MKQDEIDLMFGRPVDMHPKRRKFILNKWAAKGWGLAPNYTEEFFKIKDLIENKRKYVNKWEGKVVIAHSKTLGPIVGILEDHGDNGWHFFTKGGMRYDQSYFLDFHEDFVYFELHPDPYKIWCKLNFLFWLYHKRSDRFHQKISELDPLTKSHYKVENKMFVWLPSTNPHGKVGECYPWCQCKRFSKS